MAVHDRGATEQATRWHRLSSVLVELSDTLATTFDIDDYLHLLCQRAHELFDVQAAGVLLEDSDGALRLTAASTDESAALDLFEAQARQGPCFEAYETGEQIVDADLTAVGDRWPQFTPMALERGLKSVHAFPLRLRDDRLGAMNLFREVPGHFDEADVAAAQALADMATIAIVSRRQYDAVQLRTGQLQGALDSRIFIEQAKGIIAERHHVSPADAFMSLRQHARSHRQTLREVSQAIVDGTLTLDVS